MFENPKPKNPKTMEFQMHKNIQLVFFLYIYAGVNKYIFLRLFSLIYMSKDGKNQCLFLCTVRKHYFLMNTTMLKH